MEAFRVGEGQLGWISSHLISSHLISSHLSLSLFRMTPSSDCASSHHNVALLSQIQNLVVRRKGRADFGASEGYWHSSVFGRILLSAISIVREGEEAEFLLSIPVAASLDEPDTWPTHKLALFVVKVVACDVLDAFDFTYEREAWSKDVE